MFKGDSNSAIADPSSDASDSNLDLHAGVRIHDSEGNDFDVTYDDDEPASGHKRYREERPKRKYEQGKEPSSDIVEVKILYCTS